VCVIRAAVLAGVCLIPGISLGAEPATYSERDFSHVEKIDTHVHLHGSLPEFMKRAQADAFRLLTINVNYSTFPPLPQQRVDAHALKQKYPDRVAFAATFDASDSQQPGWLTRVENQLEQDLAHGAVGVKVWKDVGLQLRDPDGRPVMVDDARFTPIFRFLEQRRVVVLGHQGEPRNAWLSLDEMTTRGDRQYFTEHPEYHMFAHAEWPEYEEQLAARDRLLARHSQMKFIALHLASLEWSVDRIDQFLSRYPHASVDLAARSVHLKLQASSDRERVRQFFIRFQDRIVYATDLTRLPEQSDAAFAEEAHTVWLNDWRFLAGRGELRSDEFEAPFRGLALPRNVLDKIYHDNARRLFPSAWRD
jgi:predicted TIM-barrel fold metal-dependent hydrolase